jgi:tRNA nucleotidyltransferase (CCA-adding enzyme)
VALSLTKQPSSISDAQTARMENAARMFLEAPSATTIGRSANIAMVLEMVRKAAVLRVKVQAGFMSASSESNHEK